MTRATIHFNQVSVGDTPRIVGVLSDLSALPAAPACDIVEVRLDRSSVDPRDWTPAVDRLEAAGWPVICTLRLASEGGQWRAPDMDRLPLLLTALKHAACVDIEGQSPLLPELARHAFEAGKALIVSHHDFVQTPSTDQLKQWIERAARFPGVVVKIAAQIQTPDDIDRLQAVLAEPHPIPLCLIGMGDLGVPTRFTFPHLGSCLTYGYLDASTAPGQSSCEALREQIGTPFHPSSGN